MKNFSITVLLLAATTLTNLSLAQVENEKSKYYLSANPSGIQLFTKIGPSYNGFNLCVSGGLEANYIFKKNYVLSVEFVSSSEATGLESPSELYHHIGIPFGGRLTSKNERVNYGFQIGPSVLYGRVRTTKIESDPWVTLFTFGLSNFQYNSRFFSNVGLLLKSDIVISTRNRFVYGFEITTNINKTRSLLMPLFKLGLDLRPKAKPGLK